MKGCPYPVFARGRHTAGLRRVAQHPVDQLGLGGVGVPGLVVGREADQ